MVFIPPNVTRIVEFISYLFIHYHHDSSAKYKIMCQLVASTSKIDKSDVC